MDRHVTDSDVLNNISDDIIYLRDLVARERVSLNFLKESHLARLVIVFVATGMEGYRDIQARAHFNCNSIQWKDFFEKFYQNESLKGWSEIIGLSRSEVEMKVNAIKSLRDIIAHGLVDESAHNFTRKIELIGNFLPVNPAMLKIEHIDKIFEFDQQFVNLLGGGFASISREK